MNSPQSHREHRVEDEFNEFLCALCGSVVHIFLRPRRARPRAWNALWLELPCETARRIDKARSIAIRSAALHRTAPRRRMPMVQMPLEEPLDLLHRIVDEGEDHRDH